MPCDVFDYHAANNVTSFAFVGLAGAAPLGDPPWRQVASTAFEDLDGAVLFHARAHAGSRDTAGLFLLDTGAGFLALDHAVAWRLGLSATRDSGDFRVEPTPVDSLVIAQGRLDSIGTVIGFDAQVVRRATGRQVLGLLGQAPLEQAVIVIDFSRHEIRVFEDLAPYGFAGDSNRVSALLHSTLGFSGSASVVPFRLAGDGKIVVDARIPDPSSHPDRSRSIGLIVDTGATKTALFEPALRRLVPSFTRWRTLRGLAAPTLVGAPEAAIARVPRLEVRTREGWLAVSGMDAAVMGGALEPLLSQSVGEPIAGLLGYTFLRRFRVAIDYPGRRLILDPRADGDGARPYEYAQPGIQLEWSAAGPRVMGVVRQSPAARAGIRIGDMLRRIDGRDVATADLFDVTRALEGRPGSRVRVTFERAGRTRQVQLTRRLLL